MNQQRISILVDTPLKQVMGKRAKQMGYGTISSYVRRLVIQDLQKNQDDYSSFVIDEDLLDASKLNKTFQDATKQGNMKKHATAQSLLTSLENE